MSAAEQLLSRLDGVLGASGRWRARCPAHRSQGRTLAVAEREGCVVIHCFGGCEAGAVLTAVGLSFRDLYDQPLHQSVKPTRQEWHIRDAIAAVVHEARIVLIAASDLALGRVLSAQDVDRLARAAGRIESAYRRLYVGN